MGQPTTDRPPVEAAPPNEGDQPEEPFVYYRDSKGEPIDPLQYLG